MPKIDFVLETYSRGLTGKHVNRRLRRISGLVPGIIYGGNHKPQMISIPQKDLVKHLENEAFYSHIIIVKIDDIGQEAILKDLQRHPAKPLIYHIDFLRVSESKKLSTRVPLHFTNEALSKGIKYQGGIFSHGITELEINCLPADLPEYIEVDLTNIELGQIIHLSDLELPKGVESVELHHRHGYDLPIATIKKPKGIITDESIQIAEDK